MHGALPRRTQCFPLTLAPDQFWCIPLRRRLNHWLRLPLRLNDLAVGEREFCAGLDVQLVTQGGGTVVIDVQRFRALAGFGVQAHQMQAGRFAQGIQLKQPLSIWNGLCAGAPVLQQCD